MEKQSFRAQRNLMFESLSLLERSKELKGVFWGKIFRNEKRDPSVSSGIVCYAGNLFGQLRGKFRK